MKEAKLLLERWREEYNTAESNPGQPARQQLAGLTQIQEARQDYKPKENIHESL